MWVTHLRKKKLTRTQDAQATQETRETWDPTIHETACYDFTEKLMGNAFGTNYTHIMTHI